MSYPRHATVWVHNYLGDRVAAFSGNRLTDLHIEYRFQQSETLYFTARADDPQAAFLKDDVELYVADAVYVIVELVKTHADGTAFIAVQAEARWHELADRKRLGTFTLYGYAATAGLTAIVAGSGWTVQALDPFIDDVTPYYIDSNDASILDLARKWAKVTGLELVFDTVNRRLSLVTEAGANRGVSFRYRRNVQGIERRSQPPEYTRLYPYGKNLLDVTGLTVGGVAYLDDFTYYTSQGLTLAQATARYTRERIWVDETFVTDTGLKAAATVVLTAAAQPRVNYTLKVVDLAELSGIAGDRFEIGDNVRVFDDVLGYNVATRVVRIVRYLMDPAASEVELSFLPPSVPDPNVNANRSNPTRDWELLENHVTVTRQPRAVQSILNRLDLVTIPSAEWIVDYALTGIGVGTCSLSVSAIIVSTSSTAATASAAAPITSLLWPAVTLPVTAGAAVSTAFTIANTDVPAGTNTIFVKTASSPASAAGGIDILPNGSNLWVLARGTVRQSPVLANSQTFNYTGAPQSFTVPEGVTEITITATGSAAGNRPFNGNQAGGVGGVVTATFVVTSGTIYDVIVGGKGVSGTVAGYPDGGTGGTAGGSIYQTAGGGGSSYMVVTAGAKSAAIIIAAGGGSAGGNGTAGTGGAGGFNIGGTGGNGGGIGATQTAGGAGVGDGTSGTGTSGGNGGPGGILTAAGGAGGGGLFGGGGGPSQFIGDGSGGGGGAGNIIGGYDLFTGVGAVNSHGVIVVSWTNPPT